MRMLNEKGGRATAGAEGATIEPAASDEMNKNAEGVDTCTSRGHGTGSGTSPAAPAN